MIKDPSADFVMSRFEKMRAIRAPFETDWQDARYFVRPVTQYASFAPQLQFYTIMPETMYDGTAMEALEELACALHSYLANPAERWFEIQLEGENVWDQDPDVVSWLQTVTDLIYAQYQREASMINLALHEVFLDIGSFGTCVLNQEWDEDIGGIRFSARPLQVCYFTENSRGMIDCVCRYFSWSVRQVEQEFGKLPPGIMKYGEDPDRLVDIVHWVGPNNDRDPGKMTSKNKAWRSIYVSYSTHETLSDSGYDSFPYHVARWTKLAGEVYGRAPSKKCMPDIKMLNQMEKTILKAGQKQVDPPLVLRNDAFLLPIKTSPGSLIYKEDEEAAITPLETKGNLPWGEEKAEQKRKFIKQCFYSDWIRMEKDDVEMTAYEVQDRRDEKLRLLAPIFGRIASELLGPMIARSYLLLNSRRKIPQAPGMITKARLKVGYLSPAAMAQFGTKAVTISRYLNDLAPMAQINPDIMDAIDLDKTAQMLAVARGVPRVCLRSPDDLAKIRQQKQQQQQLSAAAQTAEPISNAVKNLADASSKSPGGQIKNLIPQAAGGQQ
jgi:hypothetical protein